MTTAAQYSQGTSPQRCRRATGRLMTAITISARGCPTVAYTTPAAAGQHIHMRRSAQEDEPMTTTEAAAVAGTPCTAPEQARQLWG